MANNETIMETMDTVTTANEVAKKATDKTGIILIASGVVFGVAVTVGVKEGHKLIKKTIKSKKEAKAAKKEKPVETAE